MEKPGELAHFCSYNHGQVEPKACWPASLAESISFRLMKEAVSQKEGEEQSRKATDIDL